jgi:NinB protein
MSRAAIVIKHKEDRERAAKWAMEAPYDTRIEFRLTRRSLPQNAKLWAMLSEFSRQLPWHGLRLSPNDWKLIFLDALKRELRAVPNLDGTGFVNLGRSSSNLTKAEMTELIELMSAFGTMHNITFHDGAPPAVGEVA